MTVYTDTISTPLGNMTAASEGEALTGLWFAGQTYFPAQAGEWTDKPDRPVFKALRKWLVDYFDGKKPAFTFCLAPRGTEFQKAVWNALLNIPYGQLRTYGGIAEQIAGKRGSPAVPARAVGGAAGHNPISLLIPCHRVVGADGSLTGYAGGVDKKKMLLLLEGAEFGHPFH